MKLAGAGSQGQRKDAVSGTSECKCEAATADVEAATSYPKEPAKITNVGGYTKQQVSVYDKASIGRRCHSGLPSLEKSTPGFKASKDRLTPSLGA